MDLIQRRYSNNFFHIKNLALMTRAQKLDVTRFFDGIASGDITGNRWRGHNGKDSCLQNSVGHLTNVSSKEPWVWCAKWCRKKVWSHIFIRKAWYCYRDQCNQSNSNSDESPAAAVAPVYRIPPPQRALPNTHTPRRAKCRTPIRELLLRSKVMRASTHDSFHISILFASRNASSGAGVQKPLCWMSKMPWTLGEWCTRTPESRKIGQSNTL